MTENQVLTRKGSFTYSFSTSKSAEEVFRLLQDIEQWWSGLHGETIKGASNKVGDEFTFEAGGGAHYSKQQLIELTPNKSIVWEVTDSKLTFLQQTNEWTGTEIWFDLSNESGHTKVTFTHDGLVPEIECYKGCSSEWPKYLERFQQKLG